MVRISGLNLPNDKRLVIALTYLHGIGMTLSKKILVQLQMDPNQRTKELSEEEENRLRTYIEKNYKVEGNLRREKMTNIKRLKDINSYRGSRHAKNMPCRGQKTKTNSRTVRGNVRKTIGSGRTKVQKT